MFLMAKGKGAFPHQQFVFLKHGLCNLCFDFDVKKSKCADHSVLREAKQLETDISIFLQKNQDAYLCNPMITYPVYLVFLHRFRECKRKMTQSN